MSDWATAAVSAGGAIGGAVVVGTLGIVSERLRARGKKRERWLDLRRGLAVRFLDAVERVWAWTTTQTNMLHVTGVTTMARVSPADSSALTSLETVSSAHDASMKVLEADAMVRALHTEIDLVGSDEEKAVAKRLREAVWKFASAYGGWQGADEDARDARRQAFDEAHREYLDARDAFQETVRRGLVS